MHSGALQVQRGCRALGVAPSSPPPRATMAASSSSSIATPTTKLLRFGVADCSRSLPRPDVLIVHERRRGFETVIPEGCPVRELLKAGRVKAVVSVSDPQQAADALASAVSPSNPRLAELVRGDVIFAAAALASALPSAQSFSAKLEVVTKRSCPLWHSDYVNCRCLVTYAGPGTLFAPPEAVLSAEEEAARRRGREGRQAAAAAASEAPSLGGRGIPVDESLALQAGPFDFLFLKGRASAAAVSAAAAEEEEEARRSPPPLLPQWLLGGGGGGSWGGKSKTFPSSLALGAVHRSPEGASEQSPRLVLTVDDSCECC